MGNIESIIRPDNAKREQKVRDLVLEINSDLKFICAKANDIITSLNALLGTNIDPVVFDEHDPKQLIVDVRARFTDIEGLARARYEKLDSAAGVDKPPIDEVIKNWGKGRSAAEIGEMVDHFKDLGFAGEAAAIAASIAIIVVLAPILTTMFGFMGTIAAGVISIIGGVVGMLIVGIIAAEEKYHKLEEAITELTKTRDLLNANRDTIANAADELKLAVQLAKIKA